MDDKGKKFIVGIFEDEDILLNAITTVRDKGINIYEMGLYNYDAIINELGVIPIVGAAEIIDRADLNIESLYVIYDSLNTTYYYSPDDLKKRFVIRPDVKANIFAVLKNGFIASFSLSLIHI